MINGFTRKSFIPILSNVSVDNLRSSVPITIKSTSHSFAISPIYSLHSPTDSTSGKSISIMITVYLISQHVFSILFLHNSSNLRPLVTISYFTWLYRVSNTMSSSYNEEGELSAMRRVAPQLHSVSMRPWATKYSFYSISWSRLSSSSGMFSIPIYISVCMVYAFLADCDIPEYCGTSMNCAVFKISFLFSSSSRISE